MASARTVAVVVPSPATSPVLLATMFTSLAPMFSKGWGSSISLETVTPSLVMRGLPNDFWRTTFLPRGPSVALTARASWERPAAISARASLSNFICFAAMSVAPLFLLDVRRGRDWTGGDQLFSRRVNPDVQTFKRSGSEQAQVPLFRENHLIDRFEIRCDPDHRVTDGSGDDLTVRHGERAVFLGPPNADLLQ